MGCTQRECKPNETIIEQYTKMFESSISVGATEKLPGWQKPLARTVAWSHDMEGHAKNALSDTVSWQTKKWSSFAKFQVVASQSQTGRTWIRGRIIKWVLTDCLKMLVHGANWENSHSVWSVNNFARAVTKWTQACDRRLARLIAYIHHTSDIRQYCHVGNTAQHCRLGLFIPWLRLCWRLWGLKINFRVSLVYLWKPNFCPSQLDVQEANVSIPQFHRIWNYFVGCWIANGWTTCSRLLGRGNWSVTFNKQHCKTSHDSSRETCARQNPKTKTPTDKRRQKVDQLSDVDYVPTNTHSSQSES